MGQSEGMLTISLSGQFAMLCSIGNLSESIFVRDYSLVSVVKAFLRGLVTIKQTLKSMDVLRILLRRHVVVNHTSTVLDWKLNTLLLSMLLVGCMRQLNYRVEH